MEKQYLDNQVHQTGSQKVGLNSWIDDNRQVRLHHGGRGGNHTLPPATGAKVADRAFLSDIIQCYHKDVLASS